MQDKAECIAFTNLKGGSGKTTSCLSIGGYLAKNGKRVLVVDFDPQTSATSGLGIVIRPVAVLYHRLNHVTMPLEQPKTGGSSN